jgi:hypothetical protein
MTGAPDHEPISEPDREPDEPTSGRLDGPGPEPAPEGGAEALLRRALADAVGDPPPPRLAPGLAFAGGRRIRRLTTLSVVGVAAVVALVVAIVFGAATLRPAAAPIGPAVSPSGTPAPSPTPTVMVPGPPTGGTVTSSPGQQPPVFSVAEASGPYCGTDPALGQTVRDTLPAVGRWGPDLPMFGICDSYMLGLELPVIEGTKVGVITIVVDLVNPRVAQTTACQGATSCQHVSAGWLGSGGSGIGLVTADGTHFTVSASASFINSDLFDGGAGKLPGLANDPYDSDQLSTLAVALAGKIHIG